MRPYTKRGLEEDAGDAATGPRLDYELKGILVHSGAANGGHYYSFIKDRKSGEWFKFNDREVVPFDPANISIQCFGGLRRANSSELVTGSWSGNGNDPQGNDGSRALDLGAVDVPVEKSAYMLLYESMGEDAEAAQKAACSPLDGSTLPPVSADPTPLELEVLESNVMFLRRAMVFSPDFFAVRPSPAARCSPPLTPPRLPTPVYARPYSKPGHAAGGRQLWLRFRHYASGGGSVS